MALDKNLFTLNLEPSKIEPNALDLVDPAGTVHYRKQIIPNEAGTYFFGVYDPLSESILATASAPAATSKEKLIELHNPSATVTLTYKGTLTFKWQFRWEDHDYEWKREACYMIRKPDPPVLVAVTKEPAGKIKTLAVQILDYNLNRFDIEDRKGLEIVLLTSLLTFNDYSENLRNKPDRKGSNESSTQVNNVVPVPQAGLAPPPPPKPENWREDRIAILQAREQADVNEVVIGEEGDIDEYVKHCVSLLNDETLLFITLRSLSPSCVSKVVQVAEATKRTHYKNGGYEADEELHQYVDMFFEEVSDTNNSKGKGKGPRVINLDDRPPQAASGSGSASGQGGYQPPNALKIHLSKISMPELEPERKDTKGKGKERPKEETERGRGREREREREKRKAREEKEKSKDKKNERYKEQGMQGHIVTSPVGQVSHSNGHGRTVSESAAISPMAPEGSKPAKLNKPSKASNSTGLRAKLSAFASGTSSSQSMPTTPIPSTVPSPASSTLNSNANVNPSLRPPTSTHPSNSPNRHSYVPPPKLGIQTSFPPQPNHFTRPPSAHPPPPRPTSQFFAPQPQYPYPGYAPPPPGRGPLNAYPASMPVPPNAGPPGAPYGGYAPLGGGSFFGTRR